MPFSTLLRGVAEPLLNNVAIGVQNGATFAMPPHPCYITWQVNFVTPPGSITIQLQQSLDGVNFATVDTSTATATGANRNTFIAAPFIRARINASAGGDFVTVLIVVRPLFDAIPFTGPIVDFRQGFDVGTTAVITEEVLAEFTIPARLLTGHGQEFRIRASGIAAANANNKIVRVRFGAASFIVFNGPVNGVGWWIDTSYMRKNITGRFVQAARGGQSTAVTTPQNLEVFVDETNPIIVQVTGQNGVAAANDIVCQRCIMDHY